MPARPKSDRLRALSGETPPARPMSPRLDSNTPAPAWLDAVAATEWRRVLGCANWLCASDIAALSAYCAAWSLFIATSQEVARRGPLVPARSSTDRARPALVTNPATRIQREAGASLRAWCAALGFTPDARGRARLDDPPVERTHAERLLTS